MSATSVLKVSPAIIGHFLTRVTAIINMYRCVDGFYTLRHIRVYTRYIAPNTYEITPKPVSWHRVVTDNVVFYRTGTADTVSA